MKTCPACGAVSEDAVACADCGHRFAAAEETRVLPPDDHEGPTEGESGDAENGWGDVALEEEEIPPAARRPTREDRPWFSKRGVVAGVSAVLLLAVLGGAALGAWLLIAGRMSADYERSAGNIWSDVIARSNSYKRVLNRTVVADDLRPLGQGNRDVTGALDADLALAKALTPPARYAAAHRVLVDGLGKYRDYLVAAQAIMDDPGKVRPSDTQALGGLAEEARAACDAFVALAPFTDERAPREIWQMGLLVTGLAEKAKAEEAARRRAAEAKRRAEEQKRLEGQEAIDRQAVEETVADFTEAYRDHDVNAMRSFMTVWLRGRLDPAAVFSDPVVLKSYEITKVERKTSDRYEAQVKENHEDVPVSPAILTRLFVVVRVGDKWLVDQWVAPE